MRWPPTTILRGDVPFNTATETVRAKSDVGPVFLKAMGNRGGPHLLAAEFVGTHLARWMGLPTFDFAVVPLTEDEEIELFTGRVAQPGPAFVSREQSGLIWGGDAKTLESVVNPADIARFVLFDTWTRNCDRHPPDPGARRPNYGNVFLSKEGLAKGKLQLIAMDHTHCFHWGRNLDERLARIEFVQDEGIYGLFPPFRPYLDRYRPAVEADLARLDRLPREAMEAIVATIPPEWEVSPGGRVALVNLLCWRAAFLAEHFVRLAYPPLQLLPEMPDEI